MSGYLAEIRARHGTDLWCDSSTPADLSRMIELGACGATSNPVLIPRTIQAAPDRWRAELPACLAQGGLPNWNLYRRVAREAAAILEPLYRETGGQKGLLSIQVDPQNWDDAPAMVEQAREARAVAPNVSVKLPVTRSGLVAIEELAAEGINCTATVSFTLPQVIAVAEAFKRGKARAAASGKLPPEPLHSFAVLMVGRLDDHLRDLVKEQGLDVEPELLTRAGNAVAKRAYRVFQERGYESVLLIAALRGSYHIEPYLGAKLVISMPPSLEREFGERVGQTPPPARIDEPVPAAAIDELGERFPDFRRAYLPDGMTPAEFDTFGPTVKTIRQFVGGWQSVVDFVGPALRR